MDGKSLLILAILAGLLYGWSKLPSKRSVAGHSHSGTQRTIARHEAGHAVVARKLGGKRVHGRLYDGGGQVDVTFDSGDDRTNRFHSAVFLLAGPAAIGSNRGASHDIAAAKRALRGTGISLGQARSEARRIASRNSGAINATARRAERTGRL